MNSVNHMTLQMMKNSMDQTETDTSVIASNLLTIYDSYVDIRQKKLDSYSSYIVSEMSSLSDAENKVTDVTLTNITEIVATYLNNRKLSFDDNINMGEMQLLFQGKGCPGFFKLSR